MTDPDFQRDTLQSDEERARRNRDTVPREVADRLEAMVAEAMRHAGFRWSEWGGRAVEVVDMLEAALDEYRKAVR